MGIITIYDEATSHLQGIPSSLKQLSAYILSIDLFIIALKDGTIVHHSPVDIEAFKAWLQLHNVRDIIKDVPI